MIDNTENNFSYELDQIFQKTLHLEISQTNLKGLISQKTWSFEKNCTTFQKKLLIDYVFTALAVAV